MRILALGGAGMLGHQVVRHFSYKHEVWCTIRGKAEAFAGSVLCQAARVVPGVDVLTPGRLAAVLDECRPEMVINCVGMIKQRKAAADPVASIELNALFPHKLHALCASRGIRMIHFGTDCVFAGDRGMYEDTAPHDAQDLYGRSKSLGEVDAPGTVTLRTSMIGPELSRHLGLVEWFLAQPGPVKGFRKAIFSGFTTMEICRVLERVIERFPESGGVYNVSAAPIDKHTLLCRLRDALGLEIEIVPDDAFKCDRSLNSEPFQRDFDYTPPTWDVMLRELAQYLNALALDDVCSG